MILKHKKVLCKFEHGFVLSGHRLLYVCSPFFVEQCEDNLYLNMEIKSQKI